MFIYLLGLGKVLTLQHLNKAGRLWKDSRKDFQVGLEEHSGEGADGFQEPGVENSWKLWQGYCAHKLRAAVVPCPSPAGDQARQHFNMGGGGTHEYLHPYLRNYWKLMETGKGPSSFVSLL